ncbi:MAG: hypothetical protein KDD61_12840 [Bdellovibrionales bacterium]|nr:hypothetical protein [Bdellovibrionales bacterium]
MKESLPAVASNFTTLCKKCDAERYHKVIAHVDTTKAKVECEVCGKKSTYKLPSAKKKVTRKRVSKAASAENQWEALKEKTDLSSVAPYTIKGTFEAETAIEHPKFGLGVVTMSLATKIQVTFQDGERLLVHNRD